MKQELTISELKNIVKDLEKDLELYLNLKEIAFQKTQPSGTDFNKIYVKAPNIKFDMFTHYVMKSEEYDATIYELSKSLLAYQKRLVAKMEFLSKSDVRGYITYLREEENMIWEDIAMLVNYEERQCRRIYNGETRR